MFAPGRGALAGVDANVTGIFLACALAVGRRLVQRTPEPVERGQSRVVRVGPDAAGMRLRDEPGLIRIDAGTRRRQP
jgi:hypothetical protein